MLILALKKLGISLVTYSTLLCCIKMVQFNLCKRKSVTNRKTVNGICNECTPVNNTNNAMATQLNVNYDRAPCNPGDVLGNIKFEDFVEWMLKVFLKEMCKKNIEDLRKDLSNTREEEKYRESSNKVTRSEVDYAN